MEEEEYQQDLVEQAVERLKSAQLIPPIKAIHVLERPGGDEYLEITVWAPRREELDDAIKNAASPVPVDIVWADDRS